MLKRFLFVNRQLTKLVKYSTETTSSTSRGSFENYLKSKIKMNGPLTVASFMKEALLNPVWVS